MREAAGRPIHYIKDVESFNAYCDEWRKRETLAIDTEFIRTNTFYSRVGLLQFSDEKACVLVDPLEIDDWAGFTALLQNPACSLVMHSCSEDLNLLQTFLGCLPAKLFDTQLAAAFIGLGYSVSYQSIVREVLGIEVDKDETRSDWLKRPLSETQILYAATDVRYLIELQELLKEQLVLEGRYQWFELECSRQLLIAEESESRHNWQRTYTGISNAWRLNDVGLQMLQRLCHWREGTARLRDKPRNWIIKDRELFDLSQQLCGETELTVEAVKSVTGVDRRFLSRYAKEIVELLERSSSELEPIDRELLNTPLPPALRKQLKACQKVVSDRALDLGMAPELLGRKKQLLELIRNYARAGSLVWSGEISAWRQEILEPEFSKIMPGDV